MPYLKINCFNFCITQEIVITQAQIVGLPQSYYYYYYYYYYHPLWWCSFTEHVTAYIHEMYFILFMVYRFVSVLVQY